MVSGSTLQIESMEEYKKYLEKEGCKTLDELDEMLWYNYGVTLELSSQMQEKIKLYENFPPETGNV